MGRDGVQGFLRFSGDVHILRRESPGLIGRRQQCGAPAPPLSVVLTARLPSSQAWILTLFSDKPGGICLRPFGRGCSSPTSPVPSMRWFQHSWLLVILLDGVKHPSSETWVAFLWGQVLSPRASLGHGVPHLPQASPGVCLRPPHSGRWIPLDSLKKNNPSVHP